MKRQNTPPASQSLIAQAIYDDATIMEYVAVRQVPPIAWLSLASLMLRNVSMPALANAVAGALAKMVRLADDETQLELREFAEEGRRYTFDLSLTNFEFEAFHETQPKIWKPFRGAMQNLPGGGDVEAFREHIADDARNVGMLLWLTLHTVFDAVRANVLKAGDLKPENRWLVTLVSSNWMAAPLHWHEYHRDAVGIVLAHLYNEARNDWKWPSELAPERPDLTERFLMPPLPKPYIVDDID